MSSETRGAPDEGGQSRSVGVEGKPTLGVDLETIVLQQGLTVHGEMPGAAGLRVVRAEANLEMTETRTNSNSTAPSHLGLKHANGMSSETKAENTLPQERNDALRQGVATAVAT